MREDNLFTEMRQSRVQWNVAMNTKNLNELLESHLLHLVHTLWDFKKVTVIKVQLKAKTCFD